MQTHETVLAKEAVDALCLHGGETVVEATVGSGGHAREIISRLNGQGRYIGIDADKTAIEHAEGTLTGKPDICLRVGNFRNIDSILNALQVEEVHAILADLGWRIEQMSGNGKGFSFLVDEPLIMTFGEPSEYICTAADIVNTWGEQDIANVLFGYGEERYARRIAERIVKNREHNPIHTTFDLVRSIEQSVPNSYRHGRLHPATRTFQALRIAVNDELTALTEFVTASIRRLAPKGRLAVITFHSLEDRIVKHMLREAAGQGEGTVITKHPITPADDEKKRNPRSRSAKLRIFERDETATHTKAIS